MPTCRTVEILVFLLLASGLDPADATGSDPQAAPASDSQVGYHLAPNVREISLDNGMRLLLVNRPESTTVAAGWVVRTGSANETEGKTGVSHLLEHLLFKGTRVVGSRDLGSEKKALDRLDLANSELEAARENQAGSPRAKLARRIESLETQTAQLEQHARSFANLGQLTLYYSQRGAVGLNAHTLKDSTFYYVTLPFESLELWFWMESDRLLHPVFREFYKEKRVIQEEWRLRVESTPTGLLEEEIAARFWGEHPYARSTMGSMEELARLQRADAREYFEQHYRAANLTAAIVGRFDPSSVEELARRYFGRLPKDPGVQRAKTDDFALEPGLLQTGCDCPTQARLLYRTVPFAQPDGIALEVLAGLLNGRTGRLYRSMVLGEEIAFSASAAQNGLAHAGYFSFQAESRGETRPEQLVEAWDLQLELLLEESIPETELRRVKNRITAATMRQLKEPLALLQRLLIYDGLGDRHHLETWAESVLAVRETEIQTVGRRYLSRVPRLEVHVLRREAGSARSGARP